MNASRIALCNALLPFLAVHACYLLAAYGGHVDWCFPYVDSCTSISKTGRQAPEYFLFKATMIPAGLLMILFWRLNLEWLRSLGDDESRLAASIPWLGLVAGVCLVMYTIALGHKGESFQLVRRTGVTLHFAMTFLAQLFMTIRLRAMRAQPDFPVSSRVVHAMWGVCLLVVALGLLHDFLKATFPGYDDRFEDAMEWNVALLLNIHYFLTWIGWRQSGFELVHGIRGRA